MLLGDRHNLFDRNIFAQVDDVVAIVFKQNFCQILSDIVDIPSYGSHHDGSLRFQLLIASSKFCTDRLEGFTGRFGGADQLRQEDVFLLIEFADFIQCRHDVIVHDSQWRIVFKQRVGCLHDPSFIALQQHFPVGTYHVFLLGTIGFDHSLFVVVVDIVDGTFVLP